MFGFLSSLFNSRLKSNHQQKIPAFYPNGSTLYYDPKLINELSDEHDAIVQLFQQISTACHQGDCKKAHKCFKQFATLLRAHLLKENLGLYAYLKHAFSLDAEKLKIFNHYNVEMMTSAKQINQIMERVNTLEWKKGIEDDFVKDFAILGHLLKSRIETEENEVFKWYLPPADYKDNSLRFEHQIPVYE